MKPTPSATTPDAALINDPDRLEAYDFELPDELIAQKPAEPRDASRLLVLHRASGRIEHRRFSDLPEYLDANDLVVANNTRVLKARLVGHRLRVAGEPGSGPGGRVEFVMLEEVAPRAWEGLFHASAKYVPGVRFEIPTPDGRGLVGEITRGSGGSASGTVVARFERDPIESGAGEVPLPKYIRRAALAPGGPGAASRDEINYQTMYAKQLGSAAAPTAGLHFTDGVMAGLRARGTEWAEVTLHVGVGTFRPVKDPDIAKHVMHEERYEITPAVAERVGDAVRSRASGRRVVAVGTTTVRTLESAWRAGEGLRAGVGRTDIFIRPGRFEFQVVDRLVTNFHLPRSTLLMLVSALAGRELVLEAYREAVRERYRFFSYGDAMLVV